MADGDVIYTIRADSSHLETDLNAAEQTVRQSAQRTEQAVGEISEAAQRSEESVAKATEQVAKSAAETSKSTEETKKNYKTLGEELEEVGKLLEKDSKNSTLAAQKKELLKKAIAETSDKLKYLKDRQADVNKAYRNGDIPDEEYREFQREIAATEQELKSYRDELGKVGKATDETADKTENKAAKAFGAVGKAVGAAVAAAGAAAVAVGTAAVNSADSLDKAVKHITAATGAGADAAEKYSEVIKGVYGDNFGESFEGIAGDISTITQNLGEMDEEQLKKVAESAYALQDAFDMDVAESSRAAKAMQENFGIAADKAYDYIAKGAQDGLNYSGELLDNISEYSVQFKKLGFDADDMFTIFERGSENGAWNLDKIGDAVKEFSIRAIDGSDTTKKGFEALGYDAEDMAKKLAQGGDTARAAFQTVIKALGDMEDPIAQNEAGVNLFGTMWEDLGADAVKALGEITDSAYDCAGTVDDIVEVSYSSLSDALSGLKRKAELLIQPLGEMLIPVVSGVIDSLSEIADTAIPELVEAVKPVISELGGMAQPLLELITSVLPQLLNTLTPVITFVSDVVQTILPQLTDFLENDLFPAITEIGTWLGNNLFPIITKLCERLLPPLLKIVKSLLPLLETAMKLLDPVLELVLSLIDPIADIVDILADIVGTVADFIGKALKPLQERLDKLAPFLEEVLGRALKIVAEIIGDTLLPAFEGLLDFLSGDFDSAIEVWGSGFESTMRNIFEHIDEIFGTHLAEWYDEFNDFWRNVGAKLYEMDHGDEIEWLELQNKYSNLGQDFGKLLGENLRSGMSATEAFNATADKLLTTDEAKYFFERELSGQMNVEKAQELYNAIHTATGSNAPKGSSWYADYYKNGANLPTSGKSATALNNSTVSSTPAATYKPYTPTADAAAKSSKSTTSGGSGSGGSTISITSYVPTIWDSDQTAALKSLIGRDVLGKTATAHQINSLTGVLGQQTAAKSGETTLADVVNAITKLHHKVEKMDDAIGDVTIVLKARDLTIGKAAVRDINDMAKQSGKSPFTF